MIKCEHSTKENMEVHGKAYTAMVSYPIMNGEPVKDPTYGKIAGNHNEYKRRKRASRFQSDGYC